MSSSAVLAVKPLGFPWETADPFLFCAYHDDAYPRGNGAMGPAVSLAGRDIAQNFLRLVAGSFSDREHRNQKPYAW